MKLNHDCLRQVLLTCEQLDFNEKPETSYFLNNNDLSDFSNEEILYSMNQLNSAGFIELHPIKTMGNPHGFKFLTITFEGHKFLDNIRDDSIWKKVKESVSAKAGSASISIVSQIASMIIKNQFGL